MPLPIICDLLHCHGDRSTALVPEIAKYYSPTKVVNNPEEMK